MFIYQTIEWKIWKNAKIVKIAREPDLSKMKKEFIPAGNACRKEGLGSIARR